MMEVVVTAAIRCTKLQSNCHYQQTKTPSVYTLDALPIDQEFKHVFQTHVLETL